MADVQPKYKLLGAGHAAQHAFPRYGRHDQHAAARPPRGPGGTQSIVMFEPLLTKAAHQLGIDEVEIRRINAPVTGSKFGAPDAKGQQGFLTGAFLWARALPP